MSPPRSRMKPPEGLWKAFGGYRAGVWFTLLQWGEGRWRLLLGCRVRPGGYRGPVRTLVARRPHLMVYWTVVYRRSRGGAGGKGRGGEEFSPLRVAAKMWSGMSLALEASSSVMADARRCLFLCVCWPAFLPPQEVCRLLAFGLSRGLIYSPSSLGVFRLSVFTVLPVPSFCGLS